MVASSTLKVLTVQPISPEAFQPYGQVTWAKADDRPYDREDAQLDLSQGIPRLYIMRLQHRGYRFHHITRHRQCTQCLGSLEGKTWLMAVAPPKTIDDLAAKPLPADIVAFSIPGNCFIKLHIGTWHAGPYFADPQMEFYNLELSDTNIADHHTCNLLETYGLELSFGNPDDQ